MARLFGTDGVRGLAGGELTAALCFKLGAAACNVLGGEAPVFIVGRDTRISGDMLFCALACGIMSAGGTVIDCGVIPTPAVAVLCAKRGALGAVISASHNPYADNGIKFFGAGGRKLPDSVEDKIEAAMNTGQEPLTHDKIGVMERCDNAADIYSEHMKQVFAGVNLSGLSIALDCANGAMSSIAPDYFRALGAKVEVISDCPCGTNINSECGSTHTERLCAFVRERGSDFGLAFDGDGDRLIAVDESGREVDGDNIMFILARYLKARGQLLGDTLVVTQMSNSALSQALLPYGIRIAETKVGDRYILEEILLHNYSFGGEQSGHMINTFANTTGDGLSSGTMLAAAVIESGVPISKLCSEFVPYPQKLINVPVPSAHKLNYQQSEEVAALKAEIVSSYNGAGRVLLRPSGTEALVRVMVEGQNPELIEKDAMRLAELIAKISE